VSLSPSYSGRYIDEASGSRHFLPRNSSVPYRSASEKKRGRAFHKLLSGIRIGELSNVTVSHLVLTSAPGTEYAKLNRDFQRLYKRIGREFGQIPYCKVKTKEGYGVLHVLIRTRKVLPQKWLSDKWNTVHVGSSIVWINRIYGSAKKAAGYLAAQYCSGQEFDRLSSSLNWIKKGATRSWRQILSATGYQLAEAILRWDVFLYEAALPQSLLNR